jgi:hypothetical protein
MKNSKSLNLSPEKFSRDVPGLFGLTLVAERIETNRLTQDYLAEVFGIRLR